MKDVFEEYGGVIVLTIVGLILILGLWSILKYFVINL